MTHYMCEYCKELKRICSIDGEEHKQCYGVCTQFTDGHGQPLLRSRKVIKKVKNDLRF